MNQVNLIKQLSGKDYKVALLTSFSNDLAFFETMILRNLIEQDCTYIGLFLDEDCFYHNLEREQTILELGKSYVVKAMQCKGAFHPKVFLLLGENKARLIVGSANLTQAGFLTNREICNVFEYNSENSEYLPMIQAAYSMFNLYQNKNPCRFMRDIIDATAGYNYLFENANSHSKLKFLHNCTDTLYDQINKELPDGLCFVEIMTPYFDRNLSVIKKIVEDNELKKVEVLIQDKTSNYPLKSNRPQKTNIRMVEFCDNKLYHGKVFRFKGKRQELVVFGSANCSTQAFLRTYEEGGNAEAIICVEGEVGTFDTFFQEGITRQDITKYFSTIERDIDIAEKDQTGVAFVEAYVSSNKLVVVFETYMQVLKIFFKDKEGIIKKEGEKVFASWDNVYNVPSVFNLTIETDESVIEKFTCWHHDQDLLYINQTKESRLPYYKLPNDPAIEDLNLFLDLLRDLQERLILTESDLDSVGKKKKMTVHHDAEISGSYEINENIDDYYLTEDEFKYSYYGSMGSRDLLGELINHLLRPFCEYREQGEKRKPNFNQSNKAKDLKEEAVLMDNIHEKLSRFLYKFIKGLNSKGYMENVSDQILLRNTVILFEFLWKLNNLNEKLLPKEDILNYSHTTVSGICRFAKSNIINKNYLHESLFIPQSLATILAYEFSLDQNKDFLYVRNERKKNKQLLRDINDYVEEIREQYKNILSDIQAYLNRFGYLKEKETISERLESSFPFMHVCHFQRLLVKIVKDKASNVSISEEPTLFINMPIKLNAEFNLLMLRILSNMIIVSEWEAQGYYRIVIENLDLSSKLKQYILSYHSEIATLKKELVYSNMKPRFAENKFQYKSNIIDAAAKGDATYLGFS